MENFNQENNQENVQEKIEKAKKKINTVKAIEKLEKEIARLNKNIVTKKAKIEELAKDL